MNTKKILQSLLELTIRYLIFLLNFTLSVGVIQFMEGIQLRVTLNYALPLTVAFSVMLFGHGMIWIMRRYIKGH